MTDRASAPGRASGEPLELGLNVDMTDVARLQLWAQRIEDYGSDITEWGSVAFVVEKLRDIASRLDQEIRDVGELRKRAAALSSPSVAGVEVIVNGQPVVVAAGTVRAVIEEAIRRSGQIGAPVAQWELRTTEGDIIPHNLTDGTDYELTPGRRLWLNLGPPSPSVAESLTDDSVQRRFKLEFVNVILMMLYTANISTVECVRLERAICDLANDVIPKLLSASSPSVAAEPLYHCERCQTKLPERLMTFGIGVRGGDAAWCAACEPQPGEAGEANRAEVIALRKAAWMIVDNVFYNNPQPPSLLAAPEPADDLPETLASGLALFRENPDAWWDEWQRQHDFGVTLITENERLKALLAAPEGRVREIVGRILWSKVTEIGGGRCYLKTNLDDVADELEAALAPLAEPPKEQ